MIKTKLNSILLVDDDFDICELLQEQLEVDDYQVDTANSVPEALTCLEKQSFDLILTDIKMPGEDGISLLKKVRLTHPNILVILMTGFGDKDIAIQSIKEGAFDFLEKPLDEQDLANALERASKFIHMQSRMDETHSKLEDAARLTAVGEIAANLAHEIKNPLAQILTEVMDLMECDPSTSSDTIKKKAGVIEKTTQRIGRIVNSLYRLSRKNQLYDKELVLLNEIWEEVFPLYTTNTKYEKITFRIDPPAEDLLIECDPTGLSQVLINLINNAFDIIKDSDDPFIEVKSILLEDQLEIRVIDSGTGMDEATVQKIMTPYYTTKARGEGLGLGLAICKRIVEDHQGSLTIDTSLKNTCFVISLPLKQSGEAPVEEDPWGKISELLE